MPGTLRGGFTPPDPRLTIVRQSPFPRLSFEQPERLMNFPSPRSARSQPGRTRRPQASQSRALPGSAALASREMETPRRSHTADAPSAVRHAAERRADRAVRPAMPPARCRGRRGRRLACPARRRRPLREGTPCRRCQSPVTLSNRRLPFTLAAFGFGPNRARRGRHQQRAWAGGTAEIGNVDAHLLCAHRAGGPIADHRLELIAPCRQGHSSAELKFLSDAFASHSLAGRQFHLDPLAVQSQELALFAVARVSFDQKKPAALGTAGSKIESD